MDAFKVAGNKSCGIGGWRCFCCGPRGKFRKVVRRTARRRLKQVDRATRPGGEREGRKSDD